MGELLASVVVTFGSTAFFVIRISFFQAEDGIRCVAVTGVQTCALPISATASLRWQQDPFGNHVAHVGFEKGTRLSELALRGQRGPAIGPGNPSVFFIAGDC